MAELGATTTAGDVRGKRLPEGVVRFAGIPYAAPPIGGRRFRPPEPPAPWPGVKDALSFGPSAPQNVSATEMLMGAGQARPTSEDCLTLNIWTPGIDDARRPVLVWLHGGSFATGSGGVPWYHGTRLVTRGDVVVVTVNYRLGAFGFLHLADLLGDGFAGSGNVGLLDQIAALAWVRDNIAGFGGDPDRVTVFGESAGGMSVATLLAMPAAARPVPPGDRPERRRPPRLDRRAEHPGGRGRPRRAGRDPRPRRPRPGRRPRSSTRPSTGCSPPRTPSPTR